MKRREVLGALAVTLGSVASVSAQGSKKGDDHDHDSAGHFEKCAKACADCQLQCHSCHHHCEELVMKGSKDHAATMKLCSECGDICALAANIVARHGTLSAEICEACAKACDECGKACAQHSDDKHMQRCAEECKKCAAACREMLKHANKHE